MPAPKDKPRIVWINIDALRADVFYKMLDAGELPNFGEVFSSARRAEKAVSVFPTVALTCQASLITGSLPGHHLITANGWFDRYGKHPTYRDYTDLESSLYLFKYKKYGAPTFILPSKRGTALGNRDLSGATPTVFDAVKSRSVRSAVICNMLFRGASEWIRPTRIDLLKYHMARNQKISFSAYDRATAGRSIYFIKDETRLPRLMQIYFAGLDGYSHRHGPAAQEKYLKKTLDPVFGNILKALRRHQKLEKYMFILSSGHGQSAIGGEKRRCIYPKELAAILETAGLVPYRPGTKQNPKSASAVFIPQGGALLLYLRNSQTKKWYDVPGMQTDIVPAARSLTDLNARETNSVPPGWIDLILVNDREKNTFLVVRNGKVFQPEKFFADPENSKKYPDAERRLAGVFGKRAPDLIVLSNYDRGFHFGMSHHQKGQHGSLVKDDSIVPLLFAGAGIEPGVISGTSSIMDISPTIISMYNLLLSECEGNVRDIFKDKGSPFSILQESTTKNI